MTIFTLRLKPFVITDDDFAHLCQNNRDMRFEQTASGEVLVISPVGGATGIRMAHLAGQLGMWNDHHHYGIAFNSTAGFKLPNGAIRSPSVSWMRQARWDSLSAEQQTGFAPICPDFVVELRPPTVDLDVLQRKMHEYMVLTQFC